MGGAHGLSKTPNVDYRGKPRKENIAMKKLILTCILVYAIACVLDLVLPIDTNRGSWWNIAYWFLDLICIA